MRKNLFRSICLLLTLIILSTNLIACSDASRLSRMEEDEQAIELFRVIEKNLNEADSFHLESKLKLSATILNLPTEISINAQSTSYDTNGENFSYHQNQKTKMTVAGVETSTTHTEGYTDGKMYMSTVSSDDTTDQKQWCEATKEDFLKHLSAADFQIDAESCQTLSCSKNSDKTWSAEYSDFSQQALRQLIKVTLGSLGDQLSDKCEIIDAKITVDANKKLLPTSMIVEFIFKDSSSDTADIKPSIIITSEYSDFNDADAKEAPDLSDYTEIPELYIVRPTQMKIFEISNKASGSFSFEMEMKTAGGGTAPEYHKITLTSEYRLDENGKLAYSNESTVEDGKMASSGNYTATVVYENNRKVSTTYNKQGEKISSQTRPSTDKKEYVYLTSLTDAGSFSLFSVQAITKKGDNTYEFNISDSLKNTLGSVVTTCDAKITITFDGDKIVKYEYYSNIVTSSGVQSTTSSVCRYN